MGKYEPLTRYLQELGCDSWETDFEGIERVLGFPLPESAYQYQAWWSNQAGRGTSQTRGWQDAGFETRNLSLRNESVCFQRKSEMGARTSDELAELWLRASKITGIKDRDDLMKSALTALIRREAAKGLIALGGTMPDASAPPRERPFA
jgi:hypothetical protein